MLQNLALLRNVGRFESVSDQTPLAPLTLIYAENGRGKTTLSAILRSCATGDPSGIVGRKRLGSTHPPHIVLNRASGPPPAQFQNDNWDHQLDGAYIFDDHFVEENVCSGLNVSSDHRQNLHELVLGSQGVAHHRTIQDCAERIEQHNRMLREKRAAIPANALGPFDVDEFCDLPARENIDDAIRDTERSLAAAEAQKPIRNTSEFNQVTLPRLDLAEIADLLARGLPDLEAQAVERVQDHLQGLGAGGEPWVADGVRRMDDSPDAPCPFCAQRTDNSPVVVHYRAYFSDAYRELKEAVSSSLRGIEQEHGTDAVRRFERAINAWMEGGRFWAEYASIPEIKLDVDSVVAAWGAACEAVAELLRVKQGAPLERIAVSGQAEQAVEAFETARNAVDALNQQLQAANDRIRAVKAAAAHGDRNALRGELARLKATRERQQPAIATLCDDYLTEKRVKEGVEGERNLARDRLTEYRETVFPQYERAINTYLSRFGAGFKLDAVRAANTRGGSTCNYNVVINDVPVAVGAASVQPGEPSFRTTLSSGDRNALALAFFFASLDQDPDLANKLVVIDDPVSSLDDHRSVQTVREVRRLTEQAGQVIVLSHNKPFLCRIWEHASTADRVAIELFRSGAGSSVRAWNVNEDCITEHDRRDAMFRRYLNQDDGNRREIAKAIRPHLEAFLRVAYPQHLVMHFTLAIDDLAIGLGLAQKQLLSQAVEYSAHMPRTATVKTEGELVQIRLKVSGADVALMRSTQPPLEQGRDQMHMSKELHRQLTIASGWRDTMGISRLGQAGVALPAVRVDCRAGVDNVLDKPHQAGSRAIGHVAQTDPSHLRPFQLHRDHDQGFAHQLPAMHARFAGPKVRLIHFDATAQRFATQADHRLPQLLKHQPSRAIAAQPKFSLQTRGTQARLLRTNQPHRQQPAPQRYAGVVQDRVRGQRSLSLARGTEDRAPGGRPALDAATRGANKSFRPSQLHQVRRACLVGGEPPGERHEIPWKRLAHTCQSSPNMH